MENPGKTVKIAASTHKELKAFAGTKLKLGALLTEIIEDYLKAQGPKRKPRRKQR